MKLTGDKLDFNFDEARRSEARIRSYAEEIERVFKNLRNKVDESPSWWTGASHDAFSREAYGFLAQKHNVLNVIKVMADDMARAIEDKTRQAEETIALINRQAGEISDALNESAIQNND